MPLLWVRSPPSKYAKYQMSWNELCTLMDSYGITKQVKDAFLPDFDVFYTDANSWVTIMPWVQIVSGAYKPTKFDCDDFARKCVADTAFYFGLNGCVNLWGRTPLGQHAFVGLPISKQELLICEPNKGFNFSGKLFKPTENGYFPTSWKP